MIAFFKVPFKRFALLLALSVCLLPILSFASTFSDTEGHWAADYIETVASLNMISGYEDGRFLPDQTLSRAEFIAMMVNASQAEVEPSTDSYWASPYIQTAIDKGILAADEYGGDTQEIYDRPITREEMASILINTYIPDKNAQDTAGITLELTDADSISPQYETQVVLAVSLEFFTGFPDGSFRPSDKATRAQAAVIMTKYLTATGYETPNDDTDDTEIPPSDAAALDTAFGIEGIEIGDDEASVSETLGEPIRIDASPYDFEWWIYHDQYKDYYMIGIGANGVEALYAASDTLVSKLDLSMGMKKSKVTAVLGSPVDSIRKSGKSYAQTNSAEMATYRYDDIYFTAYFDTGNDGEMFSAFLVDVNSETKMDGLYGDQTSTVRLAYEKEVWDLTNVFRVSQGLYPLEYNDAIAITARNHSEDMAERGFFSHTNPDGESPFERILADGIDYSYAAENIAAGYPNVFAVQAGWLASEGHRENLLREMTYMGVGVYFGGDYHVYYTQDFYAP